VRRVGFYTAVAATLAAVVLPAAGSARHEQTGRKLDTIRFSVGIDTAYAPFFVAKNEGIFRKHGLDVNLVQFAQGGDGVDAMIARAIDAGGSGDATVLGKSLRGPLKAFAVFNSSGDYIKLTVRKSISHVRQIKKIGIVPGSLSHYGAFKMLDYFKIPRTSVTFVRGGPPDMPVLLQRGDIDAYVIWEPWPTRAVENGSGKVLMRTKAFKYRYVLMLIARADWFASHRSETQRFVRAIDEADRLVERKPNVAAADTEKEVRVPPKDSIIAVQQIDFGVRDLTSRDLTNFKDIASFLLDQKITPREPDAASVVVRGFVSRAITGRATRKDDRLLGTYGDDVINGLAGSDRINGREGADRLTGGPGKDTILGGPGNDTVNARDGSRDVVTCGAGKDVVKADSQDRVSGCEKR
jgi:ABC-type nitrate/sulfonate/bicarbonate transport system substrate-binding protein